MTDCERLSDRMPEVARAGAWTADEAAHLARCAECRAEWELVLAARRLEARAPAVDVDGVTSRLRLRLAGERAAAGRRRWVWAVGSAAAAAAAIALAVTGGREPARDGAPEVAVEAEPLMPLPELEGLETAQLDTLLHALDGPLAGTAAADTTALGEDVDAELEWILATWEG